MRAIMNLMVLVIGLWWPSVTVSAEEPIIIAHRGASGYLPEHTLEAYRLGIEQGADYIEPDLVMTKDGVLVARHDVYLSSTTNVASKPEFADRKRTVGDKTDWFVMDFTLAEIKTLRARQPFPGRDTSFNDQYEIPTFDEIVVLVNEARAEGKTVGLHIEMKRPDLFKLEVDPDLSDTLASTFTPLMDSRIPVFFQCFDGEFVREIAGKTDVPLVLLVAGAFDEQSKWFVLDVNLADFYDVVDGYGLNKALLFDRNFQANGLVERLHSAEKVVHVWTARNDALPKGFESAEQELKLLFGAGIDGLFTDFPATAIGVRQEMLQ